VQATEHTMRQRGDVRQVNIDRRSIGRWIVLAAALVGWFIYFYVVDWLIMEGQGLPVSLTLMPK
jgi:hypothetical protein